jgi:hypothetical protein
MPVRRDSKGRFKKGTARPRKKSSARKRKKR